MEGGTVECSFESQDDGCRRRCRDLCRPKHDKETLQQKQTRRARQKEYHRQRRAEMTLEQHNSLLLQRREGIAKEDVMSSCLITSHLLPTINFPSLI